LRRILNVLTDGAVRQFSGREFQSLGAATENAEIRLTPKEQLMLLIPIINASNRPF